MFIQNMTSTELVREYRNDLPEIESFNSRIDSSAFVVNLLRKERKKSCVHFVRYCKTSRNNTYVNVFKYSQSDNSTRRDTKWNWQVWSFGLMPTFKGMCAIGFFEEASLAIVFQAHFFHRYKERLLKVCDWKTRSQLSQTKRLEDIIALYIKRNPVTTWMNTKSKFGDKEHVFAPINDGIALIQWDGEHIQANTFITEDMLSLQQQSMVCHARSAALVEEEKDRVFQEIYTLFNDK